MSRLRSFDRAADEAFDCLQCIHEPPVATQFQQLEPVAGSAASADVIAITEFVGELKPVLASASWARLVALTQNLRLHSQPLQNPRPIAMGTALGLRYPVLHLEIDHPLLRCFPSPVSRTRRYGRMTCRNRNRPCGSGSCS